jgi:hypothetical protein
LTTQEKTPTLKMYNMKFKKLQKINGKGSKKHQQEWKKEIEIYGV